MRAKWVDIAYSISETRQGYKPLEGTAFSRFSDLAKFVDKKSRVASSMYGVDLTKEYSQPKHEKTSLGKNKKL